MNNPQPATHAVQRQRIKSGQRTMMAKFYPTVNYNKVKIQKQSPQPMSVSQYNLFDGKYQSERVSPRTQTRQVSFENQKSSQHRKLQQIISNNRQSQFRKVNQIITDVTGGRQKIQMPKSNQLPSMIGSPINAKARSPVDGPEIFSRNTAFSIPQNVGVNTLQMQKQNRSEVVGHMSYNNSNQSHQLGAKKKIIQSSKYQIDGNIIFNTQGVQPMKFLQTTHNTTNHSNNSPSAGILGQPYKRKGRKMTSLNSKPDLVNQYNIAQKGKKSLVQTEQFSMNITRQNYNSNQEVDGNRSSLVASKSKRAKQYGENQSNLTQYAEKQQIENVRMSNASTNVTTKKVEKGLGSIIIKVNDTETTINSAVKIKNSMIKMKKDTSDDNAKDEFGITNKLSYAINQKYEVLELIGNGSYGCVSQAKCKKTGRMVALKIMKSEATMEYEIIKLLREVQLMRRLNNLSNQFFKGHPFVPQLIDIITPLKMHKLNKSCNGASIENLMQNKNEVDLSQICLVLEFVDSDMDQILKSKIDFSEEHLIKLLYNMLMSISFIHMANVMHRDIKPANILISASCEVKICDFGLARSMPQAASEGFNTQVCRKSIKQNQQMLESCRQKDPWQAEEAVKLLIAEKLVEDRPRRKEQKRYMSLHVGSRWYRAPEISIIEKQYDQASDIWGLGCILFEMLMYLLHNKDDEAYYEKHFQELRFLFQGDSCFPLSPKDKNKNPDNKTKATIAKNDQVKVILRNIGKQQNEDLSFISSSSAVNYVRDLESYKNSDECLLETRQNELHQLLKPKSTELINIMKNMLSFNPYFRMTAFECITECKLFDQIRDKKKELGLKQMHKLFETQQLVELDIDHNKAFDYENADQALYTVEDLKNMLCGEIIEINKSNMQ